MNLAATAADAAAAAAPAIPLSSYLVVALALFTIGALGVIVRRNALTVLMSVEIMLNAVNLVFLAFARYHGGAEGLPFKKSKTISSVTRRLSSSSVRGSKSQSMRKVWRLTSAIRGFRRS